MTHEECLELGKTFSEGVSSRIDSLDICPALKEFLKDTDSKIVTD